MRARSEFPSEKLDKFILRMPDGLRARLRASADTNRRSMNAEAIFLLERSISNNSENEKADVSA
ncbi:Arc family DNA-binding protein [Pararhizobium sp.]|uniref:Arc family DNA-binding protein n=1 Tax=Pararhizobium sp. TaxID=1977563 RepID=UPI003D14C36A